MRRLAWNPKDSAPSKLDAGLQRYDEQNTPTPQLFKGLEF
ncbi:hypothetical protein D1BOALGB6SA_8906 [Olavius sp. associated proteobacterium Delta 1]|nr:hypothetical protein D1BOALGB6SA_8906 [Olavius sp. associated proteobacterium Delta 1]